MKSTAVPVGLPPPEFELPDTDGVTRTLQDLVGQKLLVVFFRGFWCDTCQGQLRLMRQDHQEIVDRGGRLVAISAEAVERARLGRAEASLPFLVLCDPTLTTIERYGVDHRPDPNGAGIARPAVFLLDRDGVVRYAHVGEDPWDRPALGTLLLALEHMD